VLFAVLSNYMVDIDWLLTGKLFIMEVDFTLVW
jgi:hypothetical protein